MSPRAIGEQTPIAASKRIVVRDRSEWNFPVTVPPAARCGARWTQYIRGLVGLLIRRVGGSAESRADPFLVPSPGTPGEG
jgi:hypothetical protein